MKTEPKGLIDLCTNCPRDACPTGECPEYAALERRLRGKPRVMLEEVKTKPAEREALVRYNAAIDALEALVESEDLEKEMHRAADAMCRDMRKARITRFESMIDWHTIAGKREFDGKQNT